MSDIAPTVEKIRAAFEKTIFSEIALRFSIERDQPEPSFDDPTCIAAWSKNHTAEMVACLPKSTWENDTFIANLPLYIPALLKASARAPLPWVERPTMTGWYWMRTYRAKVIDRMVWFSSHHPPVVFDRSDQLLIEDFLPVKFQGPIAPDEPSHQTSERIVELREYVQANGPMHDKDCPGDDTCSCSRKRINDAVNAMCAYPAAGEGGEAKVDWNSIYQEFIAYARSKQREKNLLIDDIDSFFRSKSESSKA